MSRVASVYRVGGCGRPKGWSGGEAGGWGVKAGLSEEEA